MTRFPRAVAGLALVLGCSAPSDLTVKAVHQYMECIECVAGEQDRVVALAPESVLLLGDFLLHGPPVGAVKLRRDYLRELQRKQYPPAAGVVDSLRPPFRRALENYDAKYRLRAIDALALIKSPAAVVALCDASLATHRSDVDLALHRAITQIGAVC
jgi:hypothetical protein